MLLVSTDLLYFTDLVDRLPIGGGEGGGFERIIRAKEAAKLVFQSVTNFTSSCSKKTCIACINYSYSSALEIQITCIIEECVIMYYIILLYYSVNRLC